MPQPAPKPYREWPVGIVQEPPTLYVDAESTFGPLLSIRRVEGGLVCLKPDEARALIYALQEAIQYLEEA